MHAPAAPHVIDLAPPRVIAAYAGRTVLFASVLPMGVFYLTLCLAGLSPAVAVTAGWYYVGLLLRFARRRPVVGAALLGAGLMTVRAFVTF